MSSKKSKALSLFVFTALIFISSQIFTAPAKAENPVSFNLSALSAYGDAALAFFNFQTDEKSFAPAACVPAPANLVSWYRGENNANDSAGTNNGTLQGATFAAGRVGQAFSFDGADDSVQLPLNQSFQTFTLESWIKPLAAVSDPINQELIVGQASAGAQMIVRPGTNGGMRVVVQYRDTAVSFAQLSSSGDITLNDWSHLVGTFDGTTLKLYVNGVLDAQTNPANTIVQTCNTPYFIGGFQPVPDCGGFTNQPFQFFNGLIDEASIYNRALTDAEVQAIFNSGSAGKCVNEICAEPPANQISWYRGENNADDVLNANNGTLQNGAAFAAGKVGQGFNFDGTNDFVQLPNNASLNAASRTVEGWIKPEPFANANGGFIYASRDPFFAEGFSVFVGNDRSLLVNVRAANAPFSPPSFFSAVNAVEFGQFQHIAVTYNASDGTLAAYINGANVPLSGGMTLSGAIQPSNSHFIGRRQDAATGEGINGASYFKGSIDELSIYSRALSQTEIQSIVNAGSAGKCVSTVCATPPVNHIGWFRGENNGNDSQGANNGTLNGVTFADGKVGRAFHFTAQNHFVSIPNNPVLFPSNALSIEAWINPSTYAGCDSQYRIFHTVQSSLVGYATFLDCSNGKLIGEIFDASGTRNRIDSNAAITAGTFTHIAMTWDGTNLRLYINGVLDQTLATTISAIGFNPEPLRIGNASNFGFKGQIDEVSLYNRALSAAEIQAIFNAGSAGKCLPNTPLQITPTTANVLTGQTQTFSATGGTAPYTFSIFINNSGGSINAASGVYTAGNAVGTDTIRVTDANNQTADATVNVASAATRLGFIVQPSNAVAGQAISPAIQVAVQDANGNTMTSSNAAITIAFQNNPNSGGTLSGTLTRNAVNGIATFNDLSVNRAASGYTLRATANNLTDATSNAFNITPDAATKLAFVVQPSNTVGGENITPAPQVALQDQFGNVRTDATGLPVTVSIDSNPANGTLFGQTQANLQNGIAAFPLLKINNAGTGYTLVASSGSLTSATSQAFDVLNQFAVTNTNDSGAGSLRRAITNSNNAAGVQTISFNIPGTAPFSIKPTSPLPAISEKTIIDATTQPGFNGSPIVELSGELVPPASGTSRTGIRLNANASVVRGLIVNNWNTGIVSNAVFTEIKGNYIGTDATGTIAEPNSVGISIQNGNSRIGGTAAADRNLISGNVSAGIVRDGFDYPTVSFIDGNFIGTKIDGISPLGNGTGIFVFGRRVFVGNEAANVIAFNIQNGINILSPGNANLDGEAGIQVNSIHSNGGRGIKIGSGFSPTVNDPLDADAGDNLIQNYPVITSVTSSGGTTVIRGTLNSEPDKLYSIRFFSNQACDSSGHGEGENHIGLDFVSTDAGGIGSFAKTFNTPVAVGSFVTATATVFPGITSEFSRCQIVAGTSNAISGQIRDTNNQPISAARVNLQGTSISTLTDSNGDYVFNNLPGGFNYTIAPNAPSISFNPPTRVVNNLSANQTNQNFSGTRLSRVSGQITSAINGANFPISGATVTLSGASGATAQTDVNGNYVFNNVVNGNYQATPTKAGFAFLPASVSLNVNGGDRTANFSSALIAGLSGRILSSYVTVGAFNADGSSQIYLGLSDMNFGCIQNSCQIALDTKISPDGSKIAYIEATKRLFPNFDFINRKLYVANLDGSNRRLVYTFPTYNNFNGEDLSWSPDGTKIVFTEKQRSLKIINTDGTNLITLLALANEFYNRPDWSPDGTKILFGFNRAINIINVDGTNRRQLTSGTIDDGAKWSPNGATIAFIRRPQLNTTGAIFTMNADGSAQTAITTDSVYANVLWSPDGAKLAFTKIGVLPTNNFYGVVDPNGANLQIIKEIGGGIHSWSPIFAPPTATGTNVSTNVGAATVTFNSVSNAGATTIIPIPGYGAATIPGGYAVNGNTYEITTTANYSSPVTVCFTMPTEITESGFNRLSVLHAENGVFVDRTTSRDYPTRRICATTASLSPFAIAEQIDAKLPSIKGLVQDASGKPLVNVPVYLSGAETAETATDSDGFFKFVNLTAGANYNVQPKQIGYLFSEPNQDFVDLTGVASVVFEGAQRNFSIGGKVMDSAGNSVSNVTVSLDGAKQDVTVSGKDGSYIFTDLPADGAYTLNASNGINNFAPSTVVVNLLKEDTNNINFQKLAPIAAGVSISGRVVLPDDFGLTNALVTLTDSNGNAKTVLTGRFGTFRFGNLNPGDDYTVSVTAKNYTFAAQTVSLRQEVSDLIFTPVSSFGKK